MSINEKLIEIPAENRDQTIAHLSNYGFAIVSGAFDLEDYGKNSHLAYLNSFKQYGLITGEDELEELRKDCGGNLGRGNRSLHTDATDQDVMGFFIEAQEKDAISKLLDGQGFYNALSPETIALLSGEKSNLILDMGVRFEEGKITDRLRLRMHAPATGVMESSKEAHKEVYNAIENNTIRIRSKYLPPGNLLLFDHGRMPHGVEHVSGYRFITRGGLIYSPQLVEKGDFQPGILHQP